MFPQRSSAVSRAATLKSQDQLRTKERVCAKDGTGTREEKRVKTSPRGPGRLGKGSRSSRSGRGPVRKIAANREKETLSQLETFCLLPHLIVMKEKIMAIFKIAATAACLAILPQGLWAYGAASAAGEKAPSLERMLTLAIEDEYLARAEYRVIMQAFGSVRPFSNIIKAEERHIKMLEPLFKKYGFKAPADGAASHAVKPVSLRAALEAGVKAEEENIAMYARFLSGELPEEVKKIFGYLKSASENHLAAFRRNLAHY